MRAPFTRFFVGSLIVHGAIGAVLVYRGVGRPAPAIDGTGSVDALRVREMLRKMSRVDPRPAPPPEQRTAVPSEAELTDGDRIRAGGPPPDSTGKLVPENLKEILDKPFRYLQESFGGGTKPTPAPGADPEDLESAWRSTEGGRPEREPAEGGEISGTQGKVTGGGFAVGGKGEVPREMVERALAKRQSQMQLCYQSALLENPAVSGKLLLRWTISERGEVESVLVEDSQLDNPELHSCIVQEISKVRFPRPEGGAVVIRYPLVFSLKNY